MAEPTEYILVAQLPPRQPGGPWEVARAEAPGWRGTRWSGPAPEGRLMGSARLGAVWAEGQGPDGPCWVEDRPAGRLLSEVPGLPTESLLRVLVDVSQALALLHGAGRVHGAVSPERILLASGSGRASLVGGWRLEGEASQDLDALRALTPKDQGVEPRDLDQLDLDELIAALSARAEELGALPPVDLVDLSPPPLPAEPETWLLHASLERGPVDEVSRAIGRDERAHGLLEPWSDTTGTGATTGDRTGAIEASEEGGAGLTAALMELATGAGLRELLPELALLEPRPSGRVKALIADEPLDLLPSPEPRTVGLPGWQAVPEAPVEITAVQQSPFASTRPGRPEATGSERTATVGEITQVAGETTSIEEITRTMGVPTSRGVLLIAIGVLLGLVLAVSVLLLWPTI